MKKLMVLAVAVCSMSLMAQDKTAMELHALKENKQYDKIISDYAPKAKDLTAKSLFYIGNAYYMKEDDNNCLKFMDLSLEKNDKDPETWFFKGSTLNYLKRFDDAAKAFQSAITLNPEVGDYYSGLGDSYFNLEKLDLALDAYKKAAEQADAPDRAFAMIPLIYSRQNKKDLALEGYYTGRAKLSKESVSYQTALFNIGLMESMKGNYDKAEDPLVELIKIAPDDYHAYAKLIQVYYARKEYDKAKPYKEKLYAAYKNKELKDNLKDMFCFDQFTWNDIHIQAYERFEEGTKDIYRKHIFYILDKNGDIDYKIQTEFSAVSVEMGGPKYLLCRAKGNTHSTYSVGFNDDFKYEDLKKYVIAILENKIKPTATSQPGK